MRTTLIILACITAMSAAELEKITTTDNRVLVGYYDEDTGTMVLDGKVGGSVTLKKSQIASRTPYIKPAGNDILDRLKEEERKAQVDRDRALSEAEKFRAFAARQSGPQEAIAKANAEGSANEAARLEKVITELRQKISEVEKARQSPQPTPANEKAKPENPVENGPGAYVKVPADVAAAIAKAEALRDQAAQIETEAFLAWMKRQPPAGLPMPKLSSDPRKSEFAAQRAVTEENDIRKHMRELLDDAARANDAQSYRNTSDRFRRILREVAEAKP